MNFKIYPHVKFVSGKNRSVLYDLKKSKIFNVPQVIGDLFTKLEENTIENIKNSLPEGKGDIVDKYIEFLNQNQLGFMHKGQLSGFTELSNAQYFPGDLREAVFETDFSQYDLFRALTEIEQTGCRYLEIRVYCECRNIASKVETLMKKLRVSSFRSVKFVIKFSGNLNEQKLKEIYYSNPKLHSFYIHSAPWRKRDDAFIFTDETLHEKYLSLLRNRKYIVNLPFFLEAKYANPVYNLKIAVDITGRIKNLLGSEEFFGYVNTDSVRTIIRTKSFKKYWNIQADLIKDINDSPLRYAIYCPCPIVPSERNKQKYEYVLPNF